MEFLCLPRQVYSTNVSLEEKALQNRLEISGAVVPKLMKDLFGLGYKLR